MAVQFEKWLKSGFDIYKQNAGVLIVSSLLAILLSSLTFSILAGPMIAGLLMMVLRMRERSEPKPQIGDLFKGFDYFKETFLLWIVFLVGMFVVGIVLGWIPVVGQLLAILVSSLAFLIYWFSVGLIIEKRIGFWPAAQAAFDGVKPDIWAFLGFALLINILGSLGIILCGIGLCLTYPIYAGAATVAYRDTWPAGSADAAVPPAGGPVPAPESPPADTAADQEAPGGQDAPPPTA